MQRTSIVAALIVIVSATKSSQKVAKDLQGLEIPNSENIFAQMSPEDEENARFNEEEEKTSELLDDDAEIADRFNTEDVAKMADAPPNDENAEYSTVISENTVSNVPKEKIIEEEKLMAENERKQGLEPGVPVE